METMTTTLPAITLHFKEGSSDKLYTAWMAPANGELLRDEPATLFTVNFSYGRAGSAMKAGTKTQEPVHFAKAKVIYDKLVQEKTSKGYLPQGEAPQYSLTGEEGKDTGFRCQLLNAITEAQALELIEDWDWCMQRKWDGERRGLWVTDEAVTLINRKGLVIPGPESLIKDARELPDHTRLDGEAIGETLMIFDILEVEGMDLRQRTYGDRLSELRLWTDSWASMKSVETSFTPQDKLIMMAKARAENWEGVVFKRLDAPYTPGRPASGGTQLKFKFVESCSCVVYDRNDKRSVMLVMVGNLNEEPWVNVGSVTIPPNYEIPSVGEVVEVQYLYAFPGGSLFQPVYKGPRPDISVDECLQSQLKYKSANQA